MTRLRDDGYLETDDPIVAACFLGCDAKSETLTAPDGTDRRAPNGEWWGITLNAVCAHYVDYLGPYPYPILIPAKTVAEVWDADDVFVNQVLGSIGMYEHPTYTLHDWLHKHTEEGE